MVGCGGNGKSVSPYVAFDPHGVGHLFASTVRRVSPSYIQCPRKERQHDLFKPGRYLGWTTWKGEWSNFFFCGNNPSVYNTLG